MKKHLSIWLWLIALVSIFAGCKKDKELTELEKLPPTTQTGANTFGCLVNGKAWVAQRNDCNILCDPSFKIYYDGGFGGLVAITCVQIDIQNNIDQGISILFDSSNYKSTHSLIVTNPLNSVSFKDGNSPSSCNRYQHSLDTTVTHAGKVVLTNYNLSSGIISGTFEFTLTKPGCPTIIVTDGRFDKKL